VARTPSAIVIDQDAQSRFDVKQAVRSSGLTFSGESGFGQEAVALATDTRPDIMFVALNAPLERPLQTIESLIGLFPTTPVIAYSSSPDTDAWRNAMRAGVWDLIPMPVRAEVMRDAIVKAMATEESRRLRQHGQPVSTPAVGTIVTVFGAKGGIGKSTVSVNLAVALAKQGGSVCIVDLDTGFGDVTPMLNIKPERTLRDFVRDHEQIGQAEIKQYVSHHEESGLDVLASPGALEWRQIGVADLRASIEILQRYYDKVVLDTSGTLNEVSEIALDMATMVLWVTTSEFTSVRDSIDALRALDTLSVPRERMRIVLNASSPDDSVRADTVEQVLQREVFWQIPYDKRVRQGTHYGQPVVVSAPQSAAAKSLTDLATLISGGRASNGHAKSAGFTWLPKVRAAKAETN
jgi:pilus assembly protein CpaE